MYDHSLRFFFFFYTLGEQIRLKQKVYLYVLFYVLRIGRSVLINYRPVLILSSEIHKSEGSMSMIL